MRNYFIFICLSTFLITCESIDAQTVSGSIGGHDYVDLGLPSGTKWATCNVGAETTLEFGGYYAWGEIETIKPFASYKWKDEDSELFLKYNSKSYAGIVDNKSILDPQDDVACMTWGGAWHIPTKEDVEELVKNCSWQETNNFADSGVAGYVGISNNNGNVIFLPAAGEFIVSEFSEIGIGAYYWSSTLYCSEVMAYTIPLPGEKVLNCNFRDIGISVRPVSN